jgi:nucleotide-binding universal stress UspA family protein
MFRQIIACLDGSSFAEKILPLARGLTASTGGRLTLLRIVQDAAELAAEEQYLRECARQYNAELRFRVSTDPADAIVTELERVPGGIAALTTHGRSAWMEAVLGSIAFRVIRAGNRPVIIFRSLGEAREAPQRIRNVAVALDGSRFAERILPHAIKAAQSLSARLLLIQSLPINPAPVPMIEPKSSDILESSYLHRKADEIKTTSGIDVDWEVLHGDAGDAICRYLVDSRETLLAMTTHARPPLQRVALGSVAGECVRNSGVPLLLYWSHS